MTVDWVIEHLDREGWVSNTCRHYYAQVTYLSFKEIPLAIMQRLKTLEKFLLYTDLPVMQYNII